MADAYDSYQPPETVGVTSTVAHSAPTGEFSYGAGADSNTLNIMMLVVFAFFSLLLTVYVCAGCAGTRARTAGFEQFDVEASQAPKTGPVAELDAMWRKAFIRKVYAIMVSQLFVTVAVSFAMMQFGGAALMRWSMNEGSWAFSASFIGLIVSLCALMCNRRKFPHNLILLAIFTLTMSWSIGMICTTYAVLGMSALVVEAFAITTVIFIGLTIFTVQSKIDFSFLGMGLSVALLGLIVWGFFATFAFPSFAVQQLYALFGAFIFSGFVVYDTWLITQRLSYDEHILGAIELYLDFINLFLMILRLLTGGARE